MQTMYAKGRVMTLAGKAEGAIEVAEKVLSLDKKYPDIMGFDRDLASAVLEGGSIFGLRKMGMTL